LVADARVSNSEAADSVRKELKKATRRRAEAIVNTAQALPALHVRSDSFDATRDLVACRNGVIELRTGRLRVPGRGDLFRLVAPHGFDVEATGPAWERFLVEVLPEKSVRDYLRRFVGYALMGRSTEKVCLCLVGPKNTGKSTLIKALRAALGGYVASGHDSLIVLSRHGRNQFSPSSLRGKRIVEIPEMGKGLAIDVGRFKHFTGGDAISADSKYGPISTFAPTHSLCLVGNSLPRFGNDSAALSRLRVIRFDVVHRPIDFPGSDREADSDLDAKLAAEAAGILAWAVKGAVEYFRDGLNAPAAVLRDTEAACASDNSLAQLVEEVECVQDMRAGARTEIRRACTDVHEEIRRRARERGEQYSVAEMATVMAAVGFEAVKANKDRFYRWTAHVGATHEVANA
jgi:putative DNA primase/helicase